MTRSQKNTFLHVLVNIYMRHFLFVFSSCTFQARTQQINNMTRPTANPIQKSMSVSVSNMMAGIAALDGNSSANAKALSPEFSGDAVCQSLYYYQHTCVHYMYIMLYTLYSCFCLDVYSLFISIPFYIYTCC